MVSGLKLAQEAQAVSGPKLVDFKKVILEDQNISLKIKALQKEVEEFAEQFPIPSFHEYWSAKLLYSLLCVYVTTLGSLYSMSKLNYNLKTIFKQPHIPISKTGEMCLGFCGLTNQRFIHSVHKVHDCK